jgi:hypothetical protein
VPNSNDDLERLLRNARPTPRPGYTRELEGSLPLPRRKATAGVRIAIVIATLATVVLVAVLAGWLP